MRIQELFVVFADMGHRTIEPDQLILPVCPVSFDFWKAPLVSNWHSDFHFFGG